MHEKCSFICTDLITTILAGQTVQVLRWYVQEIDLNATVPLEEAKESKLVFRWKQLWLTVIKQGK